MRNQETAPSSSRRSSLDALQLFARYCFVPAVQAMEEEKEIWRMTSLNACWKDFKTRFDNSMSPWVSIVVRAFSQIPTVELQVHPDIRAAFERHDTTDFEALGLADKLEDDEFLNEIQSGVSQWIVQIRKVTVLPSTTPFPSLESSSTPDLEEVSFWMQLETALKQIQSELQKPTVEITLNLLKAAKRFLATIALDNNSGLEGAMAYTSDVVHYLRNYPSLEHATDFDSMATTITQVFAHLPKVRSSRHYDLERTAQLLEAFTYSLKTKMQQVLQDKCFGISVDGIWTV